MSDGRGRRVWRVLGVGAVATAGVLAACGDGGSSLWSEGQTSPESGLAPGEAGSGRMAFQMGGELNDSLEVWDLDLAERVFFHEPDQEIVDFDLSADGSTLVWLGRGDGFTCRFVRLDEGATIEDCGPAGELFSLQVAGVSADGARIGLAWRGLDFGNEEASGIGVFESGQVTRWGALSTTEQLGAMRLTDDGQTIYFEMSDALVTETVVRSLNADGTEEEVFAFDPGWVMALSSAWIELSDDGSRMVTGAIDTAAGSGVDAIGSVAFDMNEGIAHYYPASRMTISPDGRTLSGTLPLGPAAMFEFGSASPTSFAPEQHDSYAWSPDGARLAYRAYADNYHWDVLTTVAPALSGGIVIADNPGSAPSPTRIDWEE